MIVSAPPEFTIVRETELVWIGELLSLTVAVKVEAPLAVAVPEITPVEGEIDSPAGNCPELIDQA